MGWFDRPTKENTPVPEELKNIPNGVQYNYWEVVYKCGNKDCTHIILSHDTQPEICPYCATCWDKSYKIKHVLKYTTEYEATWCPNDKLWYKDSVKVKREHEFKEFDC